MVSEYRYRQVMDLLKYDTKSKTWTLPGYAFSDSTYDYTYNFSNRYQAHLYIYGKLHNEG